MDDKNKDLEERLSELKRLFEESKDKAIYYQKIAEKTGKSHLREINQLSKLIIENKHTMEALARSEKLLKDSFNAIPALFTVQDKSLRVLISNWYGYDYIPPEERLSHPYCYQAYMNRNAPCEPCHAMKVFETGKRKSIEETDPANGITKEIDIYPVLDEAVNVVSVIINIRDITELKQAEKKKKRLEKQLSQAQKMEILGTLAGKVAHDLNNVLSGIVSYPDLLLMQIPDDSPLRKSLLTIKESGNRASAIVQDLLTLTRRGVSVKEVVNLNEIINEYQKSPEYEQLRLFHPHIEIETKLETELLNITGSPIHLSKTIMNLISNAGEAIYEAGKITISTENRYIDRPVSGYEYVKEGNYVALIVSDTGVGISDEDIGKIFEPFYTEKKMGRSGTGLGMVVVWDTLKDHNGYIDIQSTHGNGTKFILYFPTTSRKSAENDTAFSIQNYLSKGESILVVDDVKQQREITSTILKELGYTVATVSSGEKAVEYLINNSVDLLVLDMIMEPGIDGLVTYKQILKLHPRQKAIITSGFSETRRVKKAQELGVGQYIKKPYTLEKIGIAIRNELDKE
ncbi:MAG: response regulator [Deltaproteobacteria bacterium]|nr:response regulator [Deltaproteobacteria bacterium]MBW1719449.1 response regulator [Deltaproteobacteria bacterium]MBW1937984.1 response regulator [Deltaproteobacteria bacterium]MBW1964792.1 response regulator [Deltaproteobacteria bacterium]MBW2079576.1 response regulator [Deltaproteobacteria bacterium]